MAQKYLLSGPAEASVSSGINVRHKLSSFLVYGVALHYPIHALTRRHMVKKCVRQSTGEMEWALVSRHNNSKILKWFGKSRPSEIQIKKEEDRIESHKHLKGKK
jgi:hypothetical protein